MLLGEEKSQSLLKLMDAHNKAEALLNNGNEKIFTQIIKSYGISMASNDQFIGSVMSKLYKSNSSYLDLSKVIGDEENVCIKIEKYWLDQYFTFQYYFDDLNNLFIRKM